MTSILIAVLGTWAGVASTCAIVVARLFRSHLRESARREQSDRQKMADLVDRTMYMAERPWNVPPTWTTPEASEEVEDRIEWPETVVTEP